MFKLPSGRAWSGVRPASKWSVPGSLIACPALTRHKCIKINSGALEYPKKKLCTIFQVFFFVLSFMESLLFIRVIFNHIYSTWIIPLWGKEYLSKSTKSILFDAFYSSVSFLIIFIRYYLTRIVCSFTNTPAAR